MTRTTAYNREQGFTLMEVLVAMSLLALLMAALSGSIGFVGRSWDRGWHTSEQSATLSRVEGTIRQVVERSFPAVVRAGKKDRFLFDGTAQGLRLVSFEAPSRSAAGLYVQEIVVTRVGSQNQLLYRRYPFRGNAAAPEKTDEAQLLLGDFNIAFSYFGSPRPKAPAAWLGAWTSDQNLPDLIQLNVRNGPADVWPPIIVRPVITAEYACVQASTTGICRLERVAK